MHSKNRKRQTIHMTKCW